ncbi:MAG: hypothetical protein QOF12_464 [Solirubrobacteraceae bacterium]|jgi:hypothetical protein|nr:hypothetical protein [Solirubrobacteraceae bacterium]
MLSDLRLPTLLPAALAVCALFATTAHAESAQQARFDAGASAFRASGVSIPVRDPGPPAGAQVLKYRFGPMKIQPGQNLINLDLQKQRPAVDGWIVGFRPGLVYASNGKSPSVDLVHLHHAVWLVGDSAGSLKPTFAAGEEKTYFNAPAGFGWRYTTDQTWIINHMIHDLTAQSQQVYITYTLWFIPDNAPQAAGITAIHTQWMDVESGKPYPVFNALKGSGTHHRFTFPTQAPHAYSTDGVVRNRWVADHDGTMVSAAGHLHPGGLWTDLTITRDGVTKRIFRSRADYFDPVGAVSWDVAMSATAPDWKVDFKQGDVITTTATYDTSRASWYEVMGIMVVGVTDQQVAGGVDPFSGGQIDQSDYLTHPRLPENVDQGVRRANPGLHNPIRERVGPYKDRVVIKNFTYSQGDLSSPGKQGRPPAVAQGTSLSFVNADAPLTERFHTITACRAPCNLTGGIGYPLADGPRAFDSGELGYGPTISSALYPTGGSGDVPISPVVDTPTDKANCAGVPGLVGLIASGCIGTTVYETPKNLTPGTYTYFCRIHPFMRGAFRVVKRRH